jgi:hypothetical protein
VLRGTCEHASRGTTCARLGALAREERKNEATDARKHPLYPVGTRLETSRTRVYNRVQLQYTEQSGAEYNYYIENEHNRVQLLQRTEWSRVTVNNKIVVGLHSNVLLNKDLSQPPRLELLDVAEFPLLCKDFVCEVSLARNVGWDLPEQLRDQRAVVLWETREESGRA